MKNGGDRRNIQSFTNFRDTVGRPDLCWSEYPGTGADPLTQDAGEAPAHQSEVAG